MPTFRFEKYAPERRTLWNKASAESPNGTFLIHRDYMEYHAARYADASLMVWQDDKLFALLPAHRTENRLFSHGGLSYGGLVFLKYPGNAATVTLMQDLQSFLSAEGVDALLYKTIPAIYHQVPLEVDHYALWRCGASLARRETLSVISPFSIDSKFSKRRQITTAKRQNCTAEFMMTQGGDHAPWSDFWALLTDELQVRHGACPTHTLSEIKALATLFPQNIVLHLAYQANHAVAGLVMFETPTTSHVQYMASSEFANKNATLDILLEKVISKTLACKRYFDFGHSNENNGEHLNTGLSFYKESFGACAMMHDQYLLPCASK